MTAPGRASTLSELRDDIERIDTTLIALIAQRIDVARQAGRLKLAAGQPVLDPAREAVVLARASRLAREAGLSGDEIRALFWQLLAMSRRAQLDGA